MEPSQARYVAKLMKILNRQLYNPISVPPPSTALIPIRHFSDDRWRPTRERDRNRFEPDGVDAEPPGPIPNRPRRGQRPFNFSFREPRRPTVSDGNNSSPLQSSDIGFAADARKRRDDSQSDNSFLERFKLGLDNRTEKQPLTNSNSATAAAEITQEQEEKLSEPEDSDEIFKKMKETGLIPSAVAMLDGLCKDGLVQEAMKLFGLMREKGTIPEVVIYTAVVDGFCKAHKLDDAKRVFRKMQNNGITPNAFSYAVLIQGLYKCNKLDDAVDFSMEMLEAGHSPNVTTFVGLVNGLCGEKGVEEAQGVIENLKQKGFAINDKAVREFLDKKAPFSPMVWEAIFGKKPSKRSF
ncbi:hypothetical protein SLE2022_052940 [Rubroshorea leprosula]